MVIDTAAPHFVKLKPGCLSCCTFTTLLMIKKLLPFLLLAAMAIAVFLLRQRSGPATSKERTTSTSVRDRGFARQVAYLVYSKHARCRMSCRQISESDVQDIMRSGTINYNKSELEKRCPVYAVQGTTNDGENLRVIFAQCKEKTTVVTCYHMDKEFECDCPGDEKKKKG